MKTLINYRTNFVKDLMRDERESREDLVISVVCGVVFAVLVVLFFI